MNIRFATEEDVPLILRFIRELAEYEKLPHFAEKAMARRCWCGSRSSRASGTAAVWNGLL